MGLFLAENILTVLPTDPLISHFYFFFSFSPLPFSSFTRNAESTCLVAFSDFVTAKRVFAILAKL